MRRLLIAAIAVGFSFSAFAADMPVKAPPPAVVSYNWTGFYIGGAVGVRRSDTDWTTTCIGGVALCPLNGLLPARIATNNPAGFDDTGFKGGLYGGYNWEVSPDLGARHRGRLDVGRQQALDHRHPGHVDPRLTSP